ncbi:MAG: helix-hairpin-helix domain-containing protein, partial [Verrucomicrobiia bacterium]
LPVLRNAPEEKAPPPEPEPSSFAFETPEPAPESTPETAAAEAEVEAEPVAESFAPSDFNLPEEPASEASPEPEPEAAEALEESSPEVEAVAEAESEPEVTAPTEPEPVEPVLSIVPPPPPPPSPEPVKPPKVPGFDPVVKAEPPPPPKITAFQAAPSSQTGAIPVPMTGELGHGAKEIRIHLNTAGVEELVKIPGVSPRLARKVLAWRELHGDFKEFSQLLSIPGMTKEIYRQFTGDPDSETALSAQVNILLGAPLNERLSLRDVALHIRRWPSIQGCIIAGAEGLPIAKDVTDGDLAESISAFLPRIMAHVNETMEQIKAMPADEVHIVSEEMGYFIYRRGGLYLVMLSSEKDLPEYYGKVVRALLQELTEGKKTRVEL